MRALMIDRAAAYVRLTSFIFCLLLGFLALAGWMLGEIQSLALLGLLVYALVADSLLRKFGARVEVAYARVRDGWLCIHPHGWLNSIKLRLTDVAQAVICRHELGEGMEGSFNLHA